jgi:hemin uptake protein HemP
MRREDRDEMAIVPEPVAAPERPASAQQTVFTSEQLFGSAIEIGIAHHGETYRLRITRQGKLVLNK